MRFSLSRNLGAPPKTVPLLRGAGNRAAGEAGIRIAALRAPLATKLVGANLLVLALLVGVWLLSGGALSGFVFMAIAGAVALHLSLALIALRPIRDLEVVAGRVWRGDYGARVERSNVADREVLRIGSMLNVLLDGLESDRARMQRLATDVIQAGDRERAAIARELHDTTAQQVAALLFQLSAAVRDEKDEGLVARLEDARDAAAYILDQVRRLSQTVHSGVLDDLGLEVALRKLARESATGTGIDFDVKVAPEAGRLPRNIEAVLYRVAEEAVRNAIRHSAASRVRITLDLSPAPRLQVDDNGRGFDLKLVNRRVRGSGLSSMKERLALVDGWLEINTAVGNGTTIAATVPLNTAPTSAH